MEGPHGLLDLVWENGRLVVNSANANQSWGSLRTVWERTFAAEEVAGRRIGNALVLGLGAGGVVKLLRSLHPECSITAVDDDPVMIRIAREHFGVKEDERLVILEQDAFRPLGGGTRRFDLVVVDLFEDDRPSAALFTPEIVRYLRAFVAPGGLLMVNTMGDEGKARWLGRELERCGLHSRIRCPLSTNRVVIGF